VEKLAYLKFSDKEYQIVIEPLNIVAIEFIKYLPISSEAQNIGGEIYFRVPGVDIKYDGTQVEEFEIGDIVYWRSSIDEDKFAVAIFYGNTKYGKWKSPRASSPCVKIGRLMGDIKEMVSILSGTSVQLHLE